MKISLDLNGGAYRIANIDYCVDLWKELMCKLYWVDHYAMDIASYLTMFWH